MGILDKEVREPRHVCWCLSPALCGHGAASLPVAAFAAEPPDPQSFARVCGYRGLGVCGCAVHTVAAYPVPLLTRKGGGQDVPCAWGGCWGVPSGGLRSLLCPRVCVQTCCTNPSVWGGIYLVRA